MLTNGCHRFRESEHQARADIDGRAGIIPSGLGSDVGSLLKSIGTNAAFGAIPVAIEHFLGGNSTRRALSGDEKCDPGPGGKVVRSGTIGGVGSAGTASGANGLLDIAMWVER